MEGTDLRGAQLTNAKLGFTKLKGSTLVGANLFQARVFQADLQAADFTDADINRAEIFQSYLFGAVLIGADLTGSSFTQSVLAGADLSNAKVALTQFASMDLSEAVGLGTVIHNWPSSIGIETLVTSFRSILSPPDPTKCAELTQFCLGAGVPKALLDAIPGIVADVQYHSCFISYGEPDRQFAEQLVKDLRARGVSCWLYSSDSTPGKRSWTEIGQNRRDAEKFVVLCSHEALVRDGTLKEIEEQIDEDLEKLVPISLDDFWRHPGFRVIRGTRNLKPFLLDRNYADFKNLPYDEALERLLRGLRRADPAGKTQDEPDAATGMR
jgi:hypothetical protein